MKRAGGDLGVAIVVGIAAWAAFATLVATLGNLLVPKPGDSLAVPVTLGLALATAPVGWVLGAWFARRARHPDGAGFVLATAIAVSGLALDAVLLLVNGFDHPGVEGARTPTLAATLLLGYATACAAVVAGAERSGRAPAGSSPRA